MTSRYNNGKIYTLRNSISDDIYVGSTCMPLHKRFYKHKTRCKDENCNYKLYQCMRDIGSEHFYIELYEEYPCDNKEQLNKREGEVMRLLNAKLNMRVAGRTKKEYYQDNIEKIKEYRKNNKEQIKKTNQKYYENNKEEIKDKKRQYYHDNKEKVKIRMKKYRENNKEQINKQKKIYYEKNKKRIKEQRKLNYQKNKCNDPKIKNKINDFEDSV